MLSRALNRNRSSVWRLRCVARGFASDAPSAPAPPHKNVTIHSLARMRAKGTPITMVTAYDFPSAVHVDKAGIDIVLVGDSVGMVELGLDTTLPVTMDDMVHHCKAVVRGCRRPLLVGDLPFGAYEACKDDAVRNATRILKEGGMDAIKMEGGESRAENVKAVVDAGIAVMGHVGLTPQSFSALGGFKAQGKTAEAAKQVLKDALAVQEAGAFAVVIECVPAVVARAITSKLSVPTIGIGSGPGTSGQVLVYHDLLGMMQHYHHAEFTPQFCKQYAKVGHTIQDALAAYRDDVKSGAFPSNEYSPYNIPKREAEAFEKMLEEVHDGDSNDHNNRAAASAEDDDIGKLY